MKDVVIKLPSDDDLIIEFKPDELTFIPGALSGNFYLNDKLIFYDYTYQDYFVNEGGLLDFDIKHLKTKIYGYFTGLKLEAPISSLYGIGFIKQGLGTGTASLDYFVQKARGMGAIEFHISSILDNYDVLSNGEVNSHIRAGFDYKTISMLALVRRFEIFGKIADKIGVKQVVSEDVRDITWYL